MHQLLLIQAFRPDRLLAMSHIFVSKALGESFMNIIEQPLDLGNIVDSEVEFHSDTFLSLVSRRVLLNRSVTYYSPAGQAQHSSAHVFCARIRCQRPR